MSLPTLITFIVYFAVLWGIGFYFYHKSVSIEDYLLGGRGMGAWVTALSAQASDMSGWLLMGLPGAYKKDRNQQTIVRNKNDQICS
jgi:sodium/proline symporter